MQVDYLHLIAAYMNREVEKRNRAGKKASSHCRQLCNPLNLLGNLEAHREYGPGSPHLGRMGLGGLCDWPHQVLVQAPWPVTGKVVKLRQSDPLGSMRLSTTLLIRKCPVHSQQTSLPVFPLGRVSHGEPDVCMRGPRVGSIFVVPSVSTIVGGLRVGGGRSI